MNDLAPMSLAECRAMYPDTSAEYVQRIAADMRAAIYWKRRALDRAKWDAESAASVHYRYDAETDPPSDRGRRAGQNECPCSVYRDAPERPVTFKGA